MANADVQPTTPDPVTAPGTPPVDGVGGERGTSAFPGNAAYDQNGQYIVGGGGPGPDLGLNYYANQNPQVIDSAWSTTAVRESSGSHVTDALTSNVVTADTLSPVHATSGTLTCTLTAGTHGDYPITGTVAFKDGATVLHTSTIVDTVTPSVTTWTNSSGYTAGAHTITAVYSGDANWATSTSAAITITAS